MKTSVLIRSYGCGEVVWLRMSASPTRAGMPTAAARRQRRRLADAEAALRRADRRKSSTDLIFLKAAGRQPYGLSMSGDMDVFQPAGRNAQMRCASRPRDPPLRKNQPPLTESPRARSRPRRMCMIAISECPSRGLDPRPRISIGRRLTKECERCLPEA
jgi:hypothetical protein